MAISDDMFRKVATAAYDLHRHRQATTFAHWLVRVLARTIGCDSAMLVSVDTARRHFALASSPAQVLPLDEPALFALHARDHPFVAKCAVSRSASAFRLSDLCAAGEFAATELSRLVYRPGGIERQLLMLVASPDALRRVIVLNRSGPDFGEEDRTCLEALWPHIVLAQRNLRRASRSHEYSTLREDARENSGVLIVSDAGDVTLCSEQARLWLAEYFDVSPFAGRVALPMAVLDWAVRRIAEEGRGRRLRVVRRDPLIITRGDHCLAIDMVVDHGKALHLVTMTETELSAPPLALSALNLTPREAEVLSWVAQGKTNREIGLILASSARTVQKHLEHVFQKLGVESRTAAILRAWQCAGVASDDPRAIRPSSRR